MTLLVFGSTRLSRTNYNTNDHFRFSRIPKPTLLTDVYERWFNVTQRGRG